MGKAIKLPKPVTSDLHDNYGILDQSHSPLDGYPMLKKHSRKNRMVRFYDWHDNNKVKSRIDNYGLREAMNLAHATTGHVTMKMLKIFEDGNEHNYREIVEKLFPEKGYGHDIDCYRSLENRGMIEFSSKHSHGQKFYKITDFGQEILRVVQTNQVYFRVARWFKIKGETDICTAMMKADLNGEESWKDLLPETLIAFLNALFNPNSEIHKLGSVYRWMNNFMYLLKTNDEFYEKIDCPEVLAWLQENKDNNVSVARFLVKFQKMQKKRAKKSFNRG